MSKNFMIPVGPFKGYEHHDLRMAIGRAAIKAVRDLDRAKGHLSSSFRDHDDLEVSDAVLAAMACQQPLKTSREEALAKIDPEAAFLWGYAKGSGAGLSAGKAEWRTYARCFLTREELGLLESQP